MVFVAISGVQSKHVVWSTFKSFVFISGVQSKQGVLSTFGSICGNIGSSV